MLAKTYYSPLNEELDEIRVLNVLPRSVKSALVCCEIETVSLLDFTSEYRNHRTLLGSEIANRKALSAWLSKTRSQHESIADQEKLDEFVPDLEMHRFNWGDFAALSYTWGNRNDTRPILVNGNEVQVTANLEEALYALSETSNFQHRYRLWVDAASINQEDF
jgi:Heterokaryon incompatibility protein (HET)